MFDLERILKYLNLGKKEFSEKIGVVPSAISKVISRKMDLPKIWIEYLEENCEINVEDFTTNE